MKDAKQTEADLDSVISKITAKGFKGLTVTLAKIRHNISSVVDQMSKETNESALNRLEMLYLRLKNTVFYEKMAAENDIHQVDLLEKKASVLLEKLNSTIRELESFNQTQEAEELRIDFQQLELLNGILQKEKTKRPLRYVQQMLSAAEGKVLRKLNSIDYELKKFKTPHTQKTTAPPKPTVTTKKA